MKMGINDLDSSSSKLDLKLFQEIFEKAEPGVIIDSSEVWKIHVITMKCTYMCWMWEWWIIYIFEISLPVSYNFFDEHL